MEMVVTYITPIPGSECNGSCHLNYEVNVSGFGIVPEEPASTSPIPPSTSIPPMIPGQWYTIRVEPMRFWRSKLAVRQPSHYQMNLTIVSSDGSSRPSSLAVYGREGQAPTVTSYDWVHMVGDNGDVKTLVKRSPAASQNSAMAVPNLVTVDKVNLISNAA